jgi:hypothetical protein
VNNEELEKKLEIVIREIVVPLRSKEVNERAFEELFLLLDQLIQKVQHHDTINRNTTAYLFFLYTQLETQYGYALSHQAEPIQKKKTKLRVYLRKVFGDIR